MPKSLAQKKRIPKKKSASVKNSHWKQQGVSKWVIIGIAVLFVTLFIIVLFSGQRQTITGNAASAITPSFGAIGDCQTLGDCPTGTTTAPPNTAITGTPGITTNPSGTKIQPCASAQDARISAMAEHRKSLNKISSNNNNGFFQLILQFFIQLLQLLQQLLGGGASQSPTPVPVVNQPSQIPSQGIQNPSQAPCPPSSAPQPTTPQSNPTSVPSTGPIPTTPVTSQSCTNPVFTSSDPQGKWPANGEPYVNNNVWNTAEAGPQTIYVCGLNSFYIISNQKDLANDQGSVKSYPGVCKCDLSSTKTISSYTNVTSSFAESMPAMGEWDAGYDIFTGSGEEIMIQHQTHNHPEDIPFPSGSTAVTIDGVAYHALQVDSGFVVLLNDKQVTSGTVNILHVFQWLISKGWVKSNDTFDMIGYGVEISTTESSPGVQGQERFDVTNWSLTAN
jgi:hypothetical protein